MQKGSYWIHASSSSTSAGVMHAGLPILGEGALIAGAPGKVSSCSGEKTPPRTGVLLAADSPSGSPGTTSLPGGLHGDDESATGT